MTQGTTIVGDGRDNSDTTARAEEFITERVSITNITDCGWQYAEGGIRSEGHGRVFQGRYRALLCLCYHELSGQKCWRCEMKHSPEQRQTKPRLTNRFATHLHKNSTWSCLRRGGHPVIWFTERRQTKATQHSYELQEGARKISTKMMMKELGR